MRRNEVESNKRFRGDVVEERRMTPLFIITLVMKILLVVLSIVILVLIAEYNSSWMIIFILAVTSCTLLYVAVSVMVGFFVMCICPLQNPTCHVAEMVISFLFLSCWLLSCGITTQVSLSAGSRTTELFGWVGACTGIGTGLLLANAVLYCVQIIPTIRYGRL